MSDEVKNDDDMDLLAAEYVLGTLDAEERSHAQSLLTNSETQTPPGNGRRFLLLAKFRHVFSCLTSLPAACTRTT